MMVFTTLLVATVALLSVEAQQSIHNPYYCYMTDPVKPQNGMHANFASYGSIRRPIVDPQTSACTPSRFWFLTRYADRMPFAGSMREMMDLANGPLLRDVDVNYEAGRTSLCELDHILMQGWALEANFTLENQGMLIQSGWDIMRDLAQRYQQHFPTILPSTYNDTQFFFRTTNEQRNIETGRAFAEGLFGAAVVPDVTFEPVPEFDFMLRPTIFCPEFDSHDWMVEANGFAAGIEMATLVTQVNQRLGFIGHNQLSLDTILIIWDVCRFEKTSNLAIPSAFCTVFSIANNQVLEYHADLQSYYRTGYGNPNQPLVQNLPCGLIQDLLNHLSSTTDENSVRVFVTNTANLHVFLSGGLWVFDDEESITRHNFEQQGHRLWRTSWIGPKAANLAVIRYDCPDGDHDVLFLFNERPLFIPGCQLNGLCKVNHILNRYQRLWNANCEQTFCSSNV